MDQSEVCAVILDRVNATRTALNYSPLTELPVGTRRDPGSCVIANALKDISPEMYVGGNDICFGGEPNPEFDAIIRRNFYGTNDAIDQITMTFISWFDKGDLPALIDPSRPEYVGASA